MARALSGTLSLTRSSHSSIHRVAPIISQFPLSQRLGFCDRRYTAKAHLIEIDLDSFSSSAPSDGAGAEVEVFGFQKLEDVIHGIIVRRSAPKWLPFRPGFSYWVPPKPRDENVLEVVGKLTNPLTEEETLTFTSPRGWPSSSFFIGEGASPDLAPVEVQVQVQVQVHAQRESDMEKSLKSEDEE